MYGYDMHWFGGFWMIFFWVLVLVGIIFLVYFLIKKSSDTGQTSSRNPMDILRERYAKGEITEEEYHRAKKEFTKDHKS